MKKPAILLIAACLFLSVAASAHPKYGPNASPLSQKTNLEYFQKNPAPDFWALIPYYLPQPTGKACGATSLTLVMNAVRSALPMTSDQKLLTVPEFVKDYTDAAYEETIFGKNFDRKNVTNWNMARLLELASGKLKTRTASTKAEVVDVDLDHPEKSRRQFFQALEENEKSADDFIVISFMQGVLTGDPEGGAHVAVIGAYDKKKKLALIMDPDREWYEPYWSPADKVFDAVRDPKADGRHPGWIHFKAR